MEEGKRLMTVAEGLRQEGRQEVKREVTCQLLLMEIEEQKITKATGLSKEEIDELKIQLGK